MLVVFILTAIIHMIDTLVYAVRFSGVATKRLATAFSLFQIVSLLASTANLIQAPLLSSVVEQAINTGLKYANIAGQELITNPVYQDQLLRLNYQIRLVILSATAGTIVGVFLTPFFVFIFNRVIIIFDETGSIFKFLLLFISPWRLIRLYKGASFPKPKRSIMVRRRTIPLAFLVANTIITAIWTTGVLSALYAGALLPDYRSTASLLSGAVNGIATILSAIIVDPTAAMITDHALRLEGKREDVKQMVYYLCLTRILGTITAQIIFWPATCLIRYIAVLIIGL